jgi:DNA polymerase III alpha subunit (gram-positive type)
MHKIQSVVTNDVETGGLNPTKNPMCSIALSSFSLADGKQISKYSTFIKPYANLTYEDAAMKYNGITYAQLNAGKDIKTVVKDLCEEFEKANTARTHTKKPVLMGHNDGFDLGFILFAFDYCKVDISKYLHCNMNHKGEMVPFVYDTMWLSRMTWGADEAMSKYNLTACCEKAGVSLTDAHDAANDVAASEALFIYFMNRLRTGGGEIGGDHIEGVKKTRLRDYFQI